MSRQIKFRVWNVNEKRFCRSFIPEVDLTDGLDFEDEGYFVQQFTGLLDKNGREIYEGDIISGSFYDEEYRHAKTLNAAVAFNNGAFNISSTNWHKPSLKVIGNIFEDSELVG